MKTATYVYCVVKRERAPALARSPRGVPGGSPPRGIKGGRSIWLVVSDVPQDSYGSEPINAGLRDMDWVSERAMAHEAVVEFCSRHDAVIPMKLFTIFRDDARAIAQVAERSNLNAIFRRIAGCSEWSVRVNCVPAAASSTQAGTVGARRGARTGASGTAFLRSKKARRDEVRRAAAGARRLVEDVHDRLSRIAKACVRKEGDVPGTSLMLDAAFLVSHAREKAFQRELQRLSSGASRTGCDVVMSGPWPAYHFVAGS